MNSSTAVEFEDKTIEVLSSSSEEEQDGMIDSPTTTQVKGSEKLKENVTTEHNEHRAKLTKNEKKVRKQMSKLGLKPVTGIRKLVMKRSKALAFVINNPDVYQVPGTDTYVVFGDATMEDLSAPHPMSEAAKLFTNSSTTPPQNIPEPTPEEADKKEEEIDESNISEQDISTVMDQCGCTRAQAVKALRNTGDLVEAILYVMGDTQNVD